MSDLKKAAQQALEALMWHDETVRTRGDDEAIEALRAALTEDALQRLTDANQEIEAALEQPEQEPVAWRYKGMMGMAWSLSDDGYYVSCKRDNGYMIEPLYTHPPRREWRGLTEGALMGIYIDFDRKADKKWSNVEYLMRYSYAIEAALKEKNHE